MPTRWTSSQTAVAIFGRDQKLTFYNRAFARLWGLPEDLARHAIPATAKSSTGCAKPANCPNSATIRPGNAQRLALYQNGARE